MKTTKECIQLLLFDGSATGVIKCTLFNWVGIIYKIPRIALDDCKGIEELNQSGVYFLFGEDDKSGDNLVYIGQACSRKNGKGLLNRLNEHKRNFKNDYWREAIAITDSNNSLGATEISFLENAFCQMAKDAKRYIVKNDIAPAKGNVTDAKEAELEKFIDFSKIVVETLGYKVFSPYTEPALQMAKRNDNEKIFYLKRKCGGTEISATCKQTSEGFVVLKGSKIFENTSPNIRDKNVLNARSKKNWDKNGNLLADTLFPSPSAAAMFVAGNSANGLLAWKDENGKTIKQLGR